MARYLGPIEVSICAECYCDAVAGGRSPSIFLIFSAFFASHKRNNGDLMTGAIFMKILGYVV